MPLDSSNQLSKNFIPTEELDRLGKAFQSRRTESSEYGGDCIYAIPAQLLKSIAKELPQFFVESELELEHTLADTLQQLKSIGFHTAGLVRCDLFDEPLATHISESEFEALGWRHEGITYDALNESLSAAESSSRQFRSQLRAYLGWLVTNPMFVADVASVRKAVGKLVSSPLGLNDPLLEDRAGSFSELCAKWQIGGFYSWDLPRPASINLGGPEIPQSMRTFGESITIQLPPTVRIRDRFPIEKLVKQAAENLTGAHLNEWQEIANRASGNSFGARRFAEVLKIHFFRNIVLRSRYETRFHGNVEAIDRALGQYLEMSADSVKTARLEIDRRLNRQ